MIKTILGTRTIPYHLSTHHFIVLRIRLLLLQTIRPATSVIYLQITKYTYSEHTSTIQ